MRAYTQISKHLIYLEKIWTYDNPGSNLSHVDNWMKLTKAASFRMVVIFLICLNFYLPRYPDVLSGITCLPIVSV